MPLSEEQRKLLAGTRNVQEQQIRAQQQANLAQQAPPLFAHDLRGAGPNFPPSLANRIAQLEQAQTSAAQGVTPTRRAGTRPPTFFGESTPILPEQTFNAPIGPTPAPAPGTAPQPPQEGGKSLLPRIFENFLAGFSGQTPEGIRANRAKSQLIQMKARDAARQQQAQANVPSFLKKADALAPFIKDAFADEKAQAKINGDTPPDRPTEATLRAAVGRYQNFYRDVPGRNFTSLDYDTLAMTERGRSYLLEKNILPPKVLDAVVTAREKELDRVRAQAIADSQRMLSGGELSQLPEGIQQQIGRVAGVPLQQIPVPGQPATTQPAPSAQPSRQPPQPPPSFGGASPTPPPALAPTSQTQIAPPIGTAPPTNGLSGVAARVPNTAAVGPGEEVRGLDLARNVPAAPPSTRPGGLDIPQGGLSLAQRTLANQFLQARIAAQAKQVAKAKEPEEILTGEEANREIRRRFGPQLNDPSGFSLFDPDETVTRKNLESTSDEFGKTLRATQTQEGQNFRQDRKFQQRDKEQATRANLSRELAATKNENIQAFLEKKGELKQTLQRNAQEFTLKRDQRRFTQQEQRDLFKANARIEQMREQLQTQAGINFTRDAINNDAESAIKFGLEASRQAGATVRGVLGDLLQNNPRLANKLLDRLGEAKQPSGETVEATKGAVADYLRSISEGGLDTELDLLAERRGMTDSDKRLWLANKRDKFPPGSPERIKIQDRLDLLSKGKKGLTINIGDKDKADLDPVTRRKLTDQILTSQNGISLIGDLLEIDTPITGPGGALTTVTNFFRGTAYDLDVLARGPEAVNTDPGTWSKFLDPSKFNTDIDKGRYLVNIIRYAVARSNEPGGRLSDRDIEAVNIGVSTIRNSKQLDSALRTAQSVMMKNIRLAAQNLESGGLRFKPTAGERDIVINELLRLPSLQNSTRQELTEFIQARLAHPSLNVHASESTIRSIFQDFEQRRGQ